MISRRGALAALGAAGMLGAAGTVAMRSKLAPDRTPWLRIHAGAEPPEDRREAPVLWLALAALPRARRASLLDEVEAALASTEARENPLLIDFVDDDVGDVFHRNQSWVLPICTASSALLASSYGAPDGFSVEVLAVNAPRGSADVPAWKREPEDARARRARFLAWPAARSIVVRGKSADAARRVAEHLRDATTNPESALAIVVDSRILDGRSPDARLDRVLSRLQRARARLRGDGGLPLSPVAPAAGVRVLPWMALGDAERLVVPKLGALSPAGRFESELRSRLRGLDADLIARA